METITVAVDADVAQADRTVSARDRRKLHLLGNLRLREATRSSHPSAESWKRSAVARRNAA